MLLPVLWLDASSAGTITHFLESVWADKSNRGNDATRTGSASALPSMHRMADPSWNFDGGDITTEPTILTIFGPIFWVIKADSNNDAFLLGDDPAYHFHVNEALFGIAAIPLQAHPTNGTGLNGATINGLSTNMNSNQRQTSVWFLLKPPTMWRRAGFSFDRTQSSRKWRW